MIAAAHPTRAAPRAGLIAWVAIVVSVGLHGAALAFLLQARPEPMPPRAEDTVEITLGALDISSTSPTEVATEDLSSSAAEELVSSEPLGVAMPEVVNQDGGFDQNHVIADSRRDTACGWGCVPPSRAKR